MTARKTSGSFTELIAQWRRHASIPRSTEYGHGARDAHLACAYELEVYLARPEPEVLNG